MALEIYNKLKKYDLPQEKQAKIDDFISFSLHKFTEQLNLLEKNSSADKYDQEIQLQLNQAIANIVHQARKLELFINHKSTLKSIKTYFREKVGFSAYQSKLVKRAFEKPQGYPGDYELLENIYNNIIISAGFGRYWDRYFLDDALAEAVRDRKNETVQYLKKYLDKTIKQKVKILNLACGSSRDLGDLFEKLNKKQKEMLEVVCFDQDGEALEYSEEILSKYKVEVSYVKGDIINISSDRHQESLGGQDIVYSIGLTDYLPNRMLRQFLSSCYDLLADKGELFISHKDHTVYAPTVQDWFCSWTFFPRIEEEIKQIILSFSRNENLLESFRGSNNIIYYFTVIK